jgi:hypothetical protein
MKWPLQRPDWAAGSPELHGDCDDLFCDEFHHRVYASCGEGYIDIVDTQDADRCFVREAVRTTLSE